MANKVVDQQHCPGARNLFALRKFGTAMRPVSVAKTSPPAQPIAQMERTRLSDQLCTGTARLTLLHAPAGFGKTTAMVQGSGAMKDAGTHVAWITLDQSDNDVSRFLQCLSMAVQPIASDAGTASATSEAVGSPSDVLLHLLAGLAARDAPFALFLDEFESLHDAVVLSLVREMIAKLPLNGRLIIGSRSIPDLALGRLRGRGQLVEVDAAQLRFTLDETSEFLTRCMRLTLNDRDIARLHGKAEGWIAALLLASIALARHGDPSEFIARFSGSEQEITRYMASQVLARQADHIRDFLLRTSILRDIDVPICNALLGRDDGEKIMAQLQARNLFLQSLDGEGQVCRYHSLFAEFLRMELRRTMPEELPRLHGVASRWYETQQRPVPAIDHALEGQDYQRALSLLSLHAGRLLAEGRMRLLARWFAAIPEHLLKGASVLAAIHGWAVCFTRGAWDAMPLLHRYGCLDSTDRQIRAYVQPLRLVALCMMDRYEEAYELGKEWRPPASFSDPFLSAVHANVMATIMATVGRRRESQQLLDMARHYQGDGGSMFNKMYSETVEGIIDLEGARLRQAAARFRLAVTASATHARSFSHRHGNAYAGVLYAETLYETNDLEQAESLLKVYVSVAKEISLADHMIKGYTLLSRVAFQRDDNGQALDWLGELEYSGRLQQSQRIMAAARLERSRIFLLQGNAGAAREELERARQGDLWHRLKQLRLPAHDLEYFELAHIRWQIWHGDTLEAMAALDSELAAATGNRQLRRVLKLRILKSLACFDNGDLHEAVRMMADVMHDTCAERYIRLFVDEGERAGLIVAQVCEHSCDEQASASQVALADYGMRLLHAFGPAFQPPAVGPDHNGKNSEQHLTPAEVQILKLVAAGSSNAVLSATLSIANSTVRTHLRNINTKLGAQNRTQAVALARRRNLIP